MNFDTLIYISEHANLDTLIQLSRSCTDLHEYLKTKIKKKTDEIPWRILVEYIDKLSGIEIHHVSMIIGYPNNNRFNIDDDKCQICSNSRWKKYNKNYVGTLPNNIIQNKHIKINVFYGKGVDILNKIHPLGYFPVYLKITDKDVVLLEGVNNSDYYDEITPRLLSFDGDPISSMSFFDTLDDNKIFGHSIWGTHKTEYNYYIHYNGYSKSYYKDLLDPV